MRALAGEQRKEPGTVAALALGLTLQPLKFGLLAVGGFLIPADLFGTAVAAGTVNGGKLPDQPLAHRTGGGLRLTAGRRRRGRRRSELGRCALRQDLMPTGNESQRRGAGHGPAEEGQGKVQHDSANPSDLAAVQPARLSHTRF